MTYETITLEKCGDVALLTLNRPDALNAITSVMAREITAAIKESVVSGSRAILLSGAGRAFCAGGDLREMKKIAASDGRIEAFFDEPLRLLNECVLLMRRVPLPIVAAVHGAASGGGCNLALACDLVIAAESARFNQAFIKIGLSPDLGGTFILPRLIGWKLATELMITGDVISATRAAELGMINRVVSDDNLMSEAINLAQRLAESPTSTIGRIKELIEASATNDYGRQLELERLAQLKSGQTSDFREGVAAFIEKRKPRFSGG